MDDQVTLLGIRHHGPGCAHALNQALEQLQPTLILLEGAEELQDSWPLMAEPGMQPPVAQLVYDPKHPLDSAIYPWAEFSPEWQAMRYASQHGIALRMMDLPVGIRIPKPEAEPAKDPSEERPTEKSASADASEQPDLDQDEREDDELDYPPLPCSSSMLDEMAIAAGYRSNEHWWDASIERHRSGLSLFDAMTELMTDARQRYDEALQQIEQFSPEQHAYLALEQRREAWMRKQLRKARKDTEGPIVVVCGAWHVPALAAKVTIKADNATLKGLKKRKMDVAWVPYNHQRLSQESGYSAGVTAPAWYEHLYQHHERGSSAEDASIQWLIRTAQALRNQGFDCSSAHVIEAVRLALNLAALRGLSTPGLDELQEASRTVMTEGKQAPLDQIRDQVVIGERLGTLPDSIPTLPIEQDLNAAIKALRLKKLDSSEYLTLDLRKPIGLSRSQLFRRLRVLNIPWAQEHHSGGMGTFKEEWELRWQPEFSLHLIDASLLGNTVELAASRTIIKQIEDTTLVADIVSHIDQLLLCHLPTVMPAAIQRLRDVSAVSADLQDLMASLLNLVQLMRYGSVRKLDADGLEEITDGSIIRVCNGLASACACLDEDASYRMLEAIEKAHSAINLMENDEHSQRWRKALTQICDHDGVHAVLAGRTTRMLHELGVLDNEALNQRFRLNVSACQDVEVAAAWTEGLLLNAASPLLYDDALFGLLDDWLMSLEEDDFRRALPLIRRSFSNFDRSELTQLANRVGHEQPHEAALTSHHDPDLAQQAVASVALLLGLSTDQPVVTQGGNPS